MVSSVPAVGLAVVAASLLEFLAALRVDDDELLNVHPVQPWSVEATSLADAVSPPATVSNTSAKVYSLDNATDLPSALSIHKSARDLADVDVKTATDKVLRLTANIGDLETKSAAAKTARDVASVEEQQRVKLAEQAREREETEASEKKSLAAAAAKEAERHAKALEEKAADAAKVAHTQDLEAKKQVEEGGAANSTDIVATTRLSAPVPQGTTSISVVSTEGLQTGGRIWVDKEETSIRNISAAALTLGDPLQQAHDVGARVTEEQVPSEEELKRRALEAEQDQDAGLEAAKASLAAREAEEQVQKAELLVKHSEKQLDDLKLKTSAALRKAQNDAKSSDDAAESRSRGLEAKLASARDQAAVASEQLTSARKRRQILSADMHRELKHVQQLRNFSQQAVAVPRPKEDEEVKRKKRLRKLLQVQEAEEEEAEVKAKKFRKDLEETEEEKKDAEEALKAATAKAKEAATAAMTARDSVAKLEVKEAQEKSMEMMQTKRAQTAAYDAARAAQADAKKKAAAAFQLEQQAHALVFAEGKAKAVEAQTANELGQVSEKLKKAQHDAEGASEEATAKTAALIKASTAAKVAESDAREMLNETAQKGRAGWNSR
eukprot:TRINITY_DN15431_c0_g1_i3.p1 TRINITY_DN15431_c0_g1~~TRINITY_DN15431_c0_g1_i3.p1  ORF type:complete len:609 (+),score=238.73 TRINITY_DN15431_c0_g1_i3:95-1921(+)